VHLIVTYLDAVSDRSKDQFRNAWLP